MVGIRRVREQKSGGRQATKGKRRGGLTKPGAWDNMVKEGNEEEEGMLNNQGGS